MSNYITLLGAEDVQRAGNRMASAADEMNRAAGATEDSLHRHRLFMDDWLSRLEAVLAEKTSR